MTFLLIWTRALPSSTRCWISAVTVYLTEADAALNLAYSSAANLAGQAATIDGNMVAVSTSDLLSAVSTGLDGLEGCVAIQTIADVTPVQGSEAVPPSLGTDTPLLTATTCWKA